MRGAKAPSVALVNPMFTRQGGNPRSVEQSQFIGDKNREEHQMNDISSRLKAAQSTVHNGSGVGRTGRVMPSHAPIESPVHGGRGGGRTRHVQPSRSPIKSPPIESPLNNDFLLTPRRSPRGHRTGVHRNLEKEYSGLHSHMRTQGCRSVPPPAKNEIQQRSNQLHNNRTQASLQPSPENRKFSQPNRSRSASNSPVVNNEEVGNSLQEGQPQRTTRKKTINLAVAKRGKEKVIVPVFKEKFRGHYRHELINSIGSWVRQRDNCPDHFILIPDDDVAVKVIKDVMRNAYKAYMHKLHGHLEALAHPPVDFPNKRDWAQMCTHFTTDEFKSCCGCEATQRYQPHNGNKSFTSIEYELLQDGQPCDPVTFFRLTHDPKKKINGKCKEMTEKMKAMMEAADRGETNDTPEEIFNKVRNAGCSVKRHRKAYPNNYIRMASLEQENKRLKKETGPKATKKWLNEYFLKAGMLAMELSSDDDAEDDDEDVDMHWSQNHEHQHAFEGSDREAEEEDVEAFGDDQEEGEEIPYRELEVDDEDE
ncbi:hypothetical protein MKW98_027320 [Papaver atlanticum]|uniref:Uncharacterized protein n=1 Tax=Papaver atlanticum TaxID=357466 RepID=A0AAD4SQP7_9MAGN|nr:hypothetical protein MKW98_027320 [Papaver atlanticum]